MIQLLVDIVTVILGTVMDAETSLKRNLSLMSIKYQLQKSADEVS